MNNIYIYIYIIFLLWLMFADVFLCKVECSLFKMLILKVISVVKEGPQCK